MKLFDVHEVLPGQITILESFANSPIKPIRLRLFEAFSGYGSQSLALDMLGVEYEHVGIAEIDQYAIRAHEALHGEVKNYGDVSKLQVEELPGMDLFTYSFPCQDISVAGKGRGLSKDSGTRSSLLWECERIIEGKRPRFLMMENVKNLVGKANKPHFDEWLRVLEGFGYNNYWQVVNAKECGIPQNRERVFCVSILKDFDDGSFKFNQPFDNGLRLKHLLEVEVDEKYYISEEKMQRLLSQAAVVKQTTIEINGCVRIGNVYGDQFGTGYAGNVWDQNGFSPAIMTMQGGGRQPHILTHYRIRKLTPKECLRLMGLNDNQIDKIQSTGISNSQQYKMAGNSIVVHQMAFLGNLPGIIKKTWIRKETI